MRYHKLLTLSENGYITRCNGCKHYRLAFGTTLIYLSNQELKEFYQNTAEQLKRFPHEGFYNQKVIQIELPTPNSCMILNYKELTQLADMLTEVNLLEQVERFLAV